MDKISRLLNDDIIKIVNDYLDIWDKPSDVISKYFTDCINLSYDKEVKFHIQKIKSEIEKKLGDPSDNIVVITEDELYEDFVIGTYFHMSYEEDNKIDGNICNYICNYFKPKVYKIFMHGYSIEIYIKIQNTKYRV